MSGQGQCKDHHRRGRGGDWRHHGEHKPGKPGGGKGEWWRVEGGKGKISTIEGLGWGNVGSSIRSGTNAEEDPREMVKPVSSRRTSSKSIFEAAVKTYDESIGLRMVGGGGAVLDMEWATKAVPESRGELRAPVRGDGGGYSKTGNPVVNEGGFTSIGGGGG